MPTKQQKGGLTRWQGVSKKERSAIMSHLAKQKHKKITHALEVISRYEALRNDWENFEKKPVKVKLEIIKNLFN